MYEKLIYLFSISSILYFAYVLIKFGDPKMYLLSVLYLLPFMNFYATKVSMGGFKVFDVVTFGALLYLLKYFLVDNYINKKYFHLLLFLLLLAIAVIGSLISEHPNKSLVDVFKIIPIFVFCRFLMLECLQDSSFHYKIINVLKLAFSVAIVFLLIQLIFGLKFTFYHTLNINTLDPFSGKIRYPGYFHDSQVQGQFFSVGSFLFLYVKQEAKVSFRLLNYFMFFMAVVAIYMCGSRSAFLGFGIGLVLSMLTIGKKYIGYLFIGVLLLGATVFYFQDKITILNRSKDIGSDLKFRQTIWKEAYKIGTEHPFFGIGSGNYEEYTKLHNPNQYFELENNEIAYFDQPENGYLKILVEFGFTGLAIFLLMVITPLVASFLDYVRGIRSNGIILFISAAISFLVAFNSVYSLFDTRMLIVFSAIIVLLITYPKNQIYGEEN